MKFVTERLLREVMVKMGLKQKDDEDGITVEILLDNGVTRLVMSSEFARKNNLKKKLGKLIYVRNVDGIFNYEGKIEHTVKVELFYRGHKKRTEMDVIEGQKWSVILEIPWLVCYNPEINWKTWEVKMMRYPYECRKQWEIKQTKPGWQKQKKNNQTKEKVQKERRKERV